MPSGDPAIQKYMEIERLRQAKPEISKAQADARSSIAPLAGEDVAHLGAVARYVDAERALLAGGPLSPEDEKLIQDTRAQHTKIKASRQQLSLDEATRQYMAAQDRARRGNWQNDYMIVKQPDGTYKAEFQPSTKSPEDIAREVSVHQAMAAQIMQPAANAAMTAHPAAVPPHLQQYLTAGPVQMNPSLSVGPVQMNPSLVAGPVQMAGEENPGLGTLPITRRGAGPHGFDVTKSVEK